MCPKWVENEFFSLLFCVFIWLYAFVQKLQWGFQRKGVHRVNKFFLLSIVFMIFSISIIVRGIFFSSLSSKSFSCSLRRLFLPFILIQCKCVHNKCMWKFFDVFLFGFCKQLGTSGLSIFRYAESCNCFSQCVNWPNA